MLLNLHLTYKEWMLATRSELLKGVSLSFLFPDNLNKRNLFKHAGIFLSLLLPPCLNTHTSLREDKSSSRWDAVFGDGYCCCCFFLWFWWWVLPVFSFIGIILQR